MKVLCRLVIIAFVVTMLMTMGGDCNNRRLIAKLALDLDATPDCCKDYHQHRRFKADPDTCKNFVFKAVKKADFVKLLKKMALFAIVIVDYYT